MGDGRNRGEEVRRVHAGELRTGVFARKGEDGARFDQGGPREASWERAVDDAQDVAGNAFDPGALRGSHRGQLELDLGLFVLKN